MKHINTGCLYQKDGQKITIWHEGDKTHMYDHSRMLGYTYPEPRLSVQATMRRYMVSDNGKLDYDIINTQRLMEIEAFHKTADFVDWASEYREMQDILATEALFRLAIK